MALAVKVARRMAALPEALRRAAVEVARWMAALRPAGAGRLRWVSARLVDARERVASGRTEVHLTPD